VISIREKGKEGNMGVFSGYGVVGTQILFFYSRPQNSTKTGSLKFGNK
jgi:hypothetical protein